MSARRTVGVLFGGRSLEHDVSVVSGLQILHAVDPDRFNPMPIYIDQSLRWWIGDGLGVLVVGGAVLAVARTGVERIRERWPEALGLAVDAIEALLRRP